MCGDYKTLEELLKEEIAWASEYGDYYFIKLSRERNSDAVWKVDKKTKKVSYMQYPAYIVLVKDRETSINPATLKRGA